MSDDGMDDLIERLDKILVSSQAQYEMLQSLARIVVPGDNFDEDQAAWEIRTKCLEYYGEHGWDFDRNLMGNLWDLWNLLLEVVQVVPHEHAGQDRMLATLRALADLEEQYPAQVGIQNSIYSLWDDLPLLATCLQVTPMTPTQMSVEMSPVQAFHWININSFSAKLWGEGLVHESWLNLPVARLREALEDPGHSFWELRVHLQVVREWIVYAGVKLYGTLSEELSNEQLAMLLNCGDLFTGVPKTPLERWEFWKGRLVEVRNHLPLHLSEFVMKIVRTMIAVEHFVDTQ